MRKKLIGMFMFMAVILLAGGIAPQTAHADASETRVFGYVKENGQPVEGARVYVICDSQGAYTDKPTDADGYYTIVLDDPPCANDSEIKVTAWGPNGSGNALTIRHGVDNRVDVALGVTIPIPEFGWIGGVVAAGSGVGLVAVIRRRFTQGSSL